MCPTTKELGTVPGDRVTEVPARSQGGAVVLQGMLSNTILGITADTDAINECVFD